LASGTVSYFSAVVHILIARLELLSILQFKSTQIDVTVIIWGLLCVWMRFEKELMKCNEESRSNVG